ALNAMRDRNFDLVISNWKRTSFSVSGPRLALEGRGGVIEPDILRPVIIYVRRFDQSHHDIAINQGAFGYAASPTELYRLVLKALYARGTDPSAKMVARDRDTLSPDVPPGQTTLKAKPTRVRVRMYRQGYGDCFLLSLGRKGNRQPYTILVDCGVIGGTPNATEKMSTIVENIRAMSMGKIDALIVTQEHSNKVSGFEQAKSSFEGISV